MDHIQLKCFISVARTLSFSEAARRNYVSQSTVSRYIKDLEKEFGVRLFERTRREVSLTNEGKLILPYAQEIIDTLNKATSAVSRLRRGSGGRLRLAYDCTSVDYPTKCLRRFTKQYPDIIVEMVELSGTEIESAVNSADYDFFFMMRDMLPDNANTDSKITHKDTLSLLLPKKFKLSSNSLSGSALKNRKFVLLSESESPILYMEIMDIFRTFHFAPDSIIEFDDVRSVYMAVAAGMGVSILPKGLAGSYALPEVRSVELDGIETDLTYITAWRKNNSNPAAHLFLDTVGRENVEDDEEYII